MPELYSAARHCPTMHPAIDLNERDISPTRIDPGQRTANLVDIAELKSALSRQALVSLRIESKLDELIAETRARELRTDYPHEDADTDARFV